jgi:hypothetical protein
MYGSLTAVKTPRPANKLFGNRRFPAGTSKSDQYWEDHQHNRDGKKSSLMLQAPVGVKRAISLVSPAAKKSANCGELTSNLEGEQFCPVFASACSSAFNFSPVHNPSGVLLGRVLTPIILGLTTGKIMAVPPSTCCKHFL